MSDKNDNVSKKEEEEIITQYKTYNEALEEKFGPLSYEIPQEVKDHVAEIKKKYGIE